MKQLNIITLFFSLTFLIASCQKSLNTPKFTQKESNADFYLGYSFSGLGSNMGSFMPVIRIKGTALVYTYEQNSYSGKKNNSIDTVCIRTFRHSSIDSIIEIVKDLGDTSIEKYNPCVMSGGIHFLSVANGFDTTNFEMSNTFDHTALKIANILNEYLPGDKKLWANEEMIKNAEDCRASLMKRPDDKKKKKSGK